jgi:hypothetical protein
MSWDWIAVLPTVLILGGLVTAYIWLGRTHKRTWGVHRDDRRG